MPLELYTPAENAALSALRPILPPGATPREAGDLWIEFALRIVNERTAAGISVARADQPQPIFCVFHPEAPPC